MLGLCRPVGQHCKALGHFTSAEKNDFFVIKGRRYKIEGITMNPIYTGLNPLEHVFYCTVLATQDL
jgi:hypothetical protein